MGYTSTKGNFVQLNVFSTTTSPTYCLAYTLWNDMIANGFSIVAQDNSSTPDSTKLAQTRIIILKPSTDIDPLWATNNWYIGFKIVDRGATLTNNNQTGTQSYPDTELQIISFGVSKDDDVPSIVSTTASDGTVTKEISQNNGLYVAILPGLKYPIAQTGKPTITTDNKGVKTAKPNTDKPPRIWTQQTYAYILTIVKRGFVLSIYDQTLDNMNYNGIYCVQRGVDKTGTMRTDGNTPLYCVTNVASRRKYDYLSDSDKTNMLNIPTNNHNEDNTLLPNSVLSKYVEDVPQATTISLLQPAKDFTRDEEQGPGPTSTWFGYILRENDDIVYNIYENVYNGYQVVNNITTEDPAWTQAKVTYYDEFNYPLLNTTLSYPIPYTGKYLHHFPSFWDGPVTADNGDYLLILPYGVCSKRFAYTDEVDLIGVSKSDAYQKLQQITINLYSNDRIYAALPSNNDLASANGHSGVRPFILIGGPDFT